MSFYSLIEKYIGCLQFNCTAECPDWAPNRFVEDHETICAPDEYVDPDK